MLSQEEEAVLAEWIIECADRGEPKSRRDVFEEASRILETKMESYKIKYLSFKWFRGFLKRHPIISRKKISNGPRSNSVVYEKFTLVEQVQPTQLSQMDIYCRLCLEYGRDFTSAFEKHEGRSTSSLVELLFDVKIKSSDEFSHEICDECLEIVQSAFILKEKISESQNYLVSQQQFELVKDEQPIADIPVLSILNSVSIETDVASPAKRQRTESLSPELPNETIFEMPEPKEEAIEFAEPRTDVIELPVKTEPEVKELLVEELKPSSEIDTSRRLHLRRAKSKKKLLSGCPKCGETFDTGGQFVAHYRKIHNDVTMPHKCPKCNNQFKKVVALNMHRKIHDIDLNASTLYEDGDPNKKRACSGCSKIFNNLTSLEVHWEWFHCPSNNPMMCFYCDTRFKTEESVKSHVVSYHRDLAKDEHIVLLKYSGGDLNLRNQRFAIFVNPIGRNSTRIEYRIKSKLANEKSLKEKRESVETDLCSTLLKYNAKIEPTQKMVIKEELKDEME